MREHALDGGIVRGAAELTLTERGWLPHRLPPAARAQCDDPQLLSAEAQPAGVRLAFRTSATTVELDLLRTRAVIVGVPDRPDGKVDLRVDGRLTRSVSTTGGGVMRADLATGSSSFEPGPVGTVRFEDLPAHQKSIEIWLPHYERIELVALRTDAPISPLPSGERRVWLHHGSSISQGSNAASPSTTWTALAAASGDLDLVSLGFAGSAMLDPYTARAMRNTAADLLSVKIGINLVNADLMRQRAFGPAVHGFLDTIRDGHPDKPLVVIGPVHCPIHEDTPGPGAFDPEALQAGEVRFIATGDPAEVAGGRLSLAVIRRRLAEIVSGRMAGDPNLHYLDGLELYGPGDHDAHPLPDNLHPDAATHELMAARFADAVFGESAPFGPR
ncbi:GDSL-like lipase/acylhydrolase family protein [Nocardioides albertanoniae]|uniref:GDSL-like lipase/acylhydrolase family protein n=1 Tax=Nocardioides albertanoniae TaxID=1175486 RepID=A0A543A5R8_9ACTN|nr:SGNH/GDSL hydrolase family protein [Nocardioides albertanoniae]TQL67897.1 GDSL-like lipase/acylhydrolase family protein [Nocardioides albertanoniae]